MTDATLVIDRLRDAINSHDLEALVGCFALDVEARMPCHPARDFRGNAQIRSNWVQIFGGVPDLQATLVSSTIVADTVWCEWDWRGTRRDGAPFAMRGVTIMTVTGDRVTAHRFYMEPVDRGDATVADAVGSVVAS